MVEWVIQDSLRNGEKIMASIINVKWGVPAEQPSIEELPSEFSQAQELWSQDKNGNFDKIVALLEPYLSARFLLSEINSYEELFIADDDEIEADNVKIVGVDFDASSPIPSVKAEAELELHKQSDFSSIDMEKWEEENGSLYDGISFCWSFDDEVLDEYDTCIYEHEGQEIVL